MTSGSSERSTITLRALEGEPLADEAVRAMVLATARAIAERIGVEILTLKADERSVTVTIFGTRMAAVGLAAELRRLTTAWYAHKYGVDSLWGEAPESGDDDEAWKQG